MPYDDEDGPELEDTPPSDPAGKASVTFDVPMPTVEQVAGEIARQLIREAGYGSLGTLRSKISDAFDAEIDRVVAEKARPTIEALLEKPFQITDRYGSPTGTPTTPLAVLAERVEAWANDPVTVHGNAPTDDYDRRNAKPRIARELEKLVNGELSKQVGAEVARLVSQLKEQATQGIATQIAARIASLVIKS